MNSADTSDNDTMDASAGPIDSLSVIHRRTLAAIFRHPLAHNLEWRSVVDLIEEVGTVHEKINGGYVFDVGDQQYVMHKPHAKDLTSSAAIDVRHFLERAGLSPEVASHPDAHKRAAGSGLVVVVDHHGAKIFHVDIALDGALDQIQGLPEPQHVLRHIVHNQQSQEEEQRAPDDPAFYEEIASVLALGGKIVLIGHGTGNSNAAHHLAEYLKVRHAETFGRIVGELTADLSHITSPELLDLARQALVS